MLQKRWIMAAVRYGRWNLEDGQLGPASYVSYTEGLVDSQ
jgi:hypothetical protein